MKPLRTIYQLLRALLFFGALNVIVKPVHPNQMVSVAGAGKGDDFYMGCVEKRGHCSGTASYFCLAREGGRPFRSIVVASFLYRSSMPPRKETALVL